MEEEAAVNSSSSSDAASGCDDQADHKLPQPVIIDIEAQADALPPVAPAAPDQGAVQKPADNSPAKTGRSSKKARGDPANDTASRNGAGTTDKASLSLIGHTLRRLCGRNTSQDTAAILASYKGSNSNNNKVSGCLPVLQGEPLLFNLTPGGGDSMNVELAIRGADESRYAVFYERLCQLYRVPYLSREPDDGGVRLAEEPGKSGLIADGRLPASRHHGLEAEEQEQRLVVTRLTVMFNPPAGGAEKDDGMATAFFTFRPEGLVFYQTVKLADWALATKGVAAVKAGGQQEVFLYLLQGGGTRLLPVQYKKMEALLTERATQLRKEQYEEFLVKLEQQAAAAAAEQLEIPPDVLGLDCEMVGVGPGQNRENVGRVSIVDGTGAVVYDTFVAPMEPVTDYRTRVSGIRKEDLAGAPSFATVQAAVAELLAGKLLVGHAVHHDLNILELTHPPDRIRDTVVFFAFGAQSKSLKYLSERFLKENIQAGRHSSVEDALAPVRLYLMFRSVWESDPKRWGLTREAAAMSTTSSAGQKQRKKKAADKEAALHKHLSQLELRVEQLAGGDTTTTTTSLVGIGVDTVMTGGGWHDRVLGRVSLVDGEGRLLFERFVAPAKPVTDYLTEDTGIRPEDLASAPSLSAVQEEVAGLLAGRLVVGHGLVQSLKLLLGKGKKGGYNHPNHHLRDLEVLCTAGGITPALNWLIARYLEDSATQDPSDWSSSARDAKAAVLLYHKFSIVWEKEPSLWGRKRPDFSGDKGNRGASSRGQGRGQPGQNRGRRGGREEDQGGSYGGRGGWYGGRGGLYGGQRGWYGGRGGWYGGGGGWYGGGGGGWYGGRGALAGGLEAGQRGRGHDDRGGRGGRGRAFWGNHYYF